jgi:predicted nucleotidyltransferase
VSYRQVNRGNGVRPAICSVLTSLTQKARPALSARQLELFAVGLADKLAGTQDLLVRSSLSEFEQALVRCLAKEDEKFDASPLPSSYPCDSEKHLLTSLESTMNHVISRILDELKGGLALLYSDRLKGIYLFGSFSRGEADAESDIDILIVLDRVDNYGREVEFASHLISQLSIACGRSISCVFASEKRWKEDGTIFFLNVREEAVPA